MPLLLISEESESLTLVYVSDQPSLTPSGAVGAVGASNSEFSPIERGILFARSRRKSPDTMLGKPELVVEKF